MSCYSLLHRDEGCVRCDEGHVRCDEGRVRHNEAKGKQGQTYRFVVMKVDLMNGKRYGFVVIKVFVMLHRNEDPARHD